MLEQQQQTQGPYPATEEEVETLVTQVINFIHDKNVNGGFVEHLKKGRGDVQEVVMQTASAMAVKIISAIEQEKGRDIPPETELGVLAMVVEELYTIASNYGKEVSPEEVQNTIQVAASQFNQIQQQMKQGGGGGQQAMQGPPRQQGPQGPPRQQGPQGPPQSALAGAR